MTLPNRLNQHAAYLLKIWRADPDAEWRVFVENVHTGETKGFHDIQGLVSFLEQGHPTTSGADSALREWDGTVGE